MRQAIDSIANMLCGCEAGGELRHFFARSPTVGRRRWLWPVLFAGALLNAACSPAESPPQYLDTGDMHHTMTWVIDPAADVIWGSAGFVITAAGTESLAPTDDAGWAQVQHSAAVLAASGNLLLLPDALPAGDQAAWAEFAAGMARIAEEAEAAAIEQDADALFAIGGNLYNVCVACHQVHDRPEPEMTAAANDAS